MYIPVPSLELQERTHQVVTKTSATNRVLTGLTVLALVGIALFSPRSRDPGALEIQVPHFGDSAASVELRKRKALVEIAKDANALSDSIGHRRPTKAQWEYLMSHYIAACDLEETDSALLKAHPDYSHACDIARHRVASSGKLEQAVVEMKASLLKPAGLE